MAFRDELAGHGDRVTVVPQDELGLLDLASHLWGAKTWLNRPDLRITPPQVRTR